MHNPNGRSVFTVLLLILLVSVPSWSQHTFRGGINGVVTDQSGAVVPGAIVQITNVATNVSLTTTSTTAGEYAFPEKNLGKYDITVWASGFRAQKVIGVPFSAVKLDPASQADRRNVGRNH